MTFTCNEKIKRWASSPPQVSQVKSRICTQVKIRRGGMGLTLQFPSWANCSSKSSTSTVPNCLIMFDIFFADLDMRIFWHVSDCLGYFDPSHPGVQCRVPKFHLGHVRGSHTLEDSIRNAVRSAAKGLGLLARESTSWEEQKLSIGEGTSPYVRHFCRDHVHWNNL